VIIKMIEQPYYFWWTHAYYIETIAPRAPLTYTYSFLSSTRYSAVRIIGINNCLKRSFVIKVATMEDFRNIWKPPRGTCNRHFCGEQRFFIFIYLFFLLFYSAMQHMRTCTRNKITQYYYGTQRRAVISPWRMHCMYSGVTKGTSRAEATLNSEKIKPVALAINSWFTRVWRQWAGSSYM